MASKMFCASAILLVALVSSSSAIQCFDNDDFIKSCPDSFSCVMENVGDSYSFGCQPNAACYVGDVISGISGAVADAGNSIGNAFGGNSEIKSVNIQCCDVSLCNQPIYFGVSTYWFLGAVLALIFICVCSSCLCCCLGCCCRK